MKDQRLAEPDYNGPVWLVWQAWHDKCHPSKIYGALPESHAAKSGWLTPIELKGDDKFLSLDTLAAKYPPLKKDK